MTHSPAELIRAAEVTAAHPDIVSSLTRLLRDAAAQPINAQITALNTLPSGPARDAYHHALNALISETYDLGEDLSAAVIHHLSQSQPTPAQPTPAAPTPVQPTPAAPTPVQPTPVQPTPAAPTPVQPTPVQPTPAAPTTWPERLTAVMHTLIGDPSPARLTLLGLALHTAGHEHLTGHISGKRTAGDITNPQGVWAGLNNLTQYTRKQALTHLQKALAAHHAAHFTPEQLAVTCAPAELDASHLRDLQIGQDPRTVPTAALLAATRLLSSMTRAPRASEADQQAFTALTGTLRWAGLPISRIQAPLTSAQRRTFERAGTTDPPSAAALAELHARLSRDHQDDLHAGTQLRTLHEHTTKLTRDWHVLPQALLEQARLIYPDLPDSAMNGLLDISQAQLSIPHLRALTDVLNLLTDDDYHALQLSSYELLAQSDDADHPISVALTTQLHADLIRLPVWYDLTLTRQGVTPVVLRDLRAGHVTTLRDLLTLREPLRQLLDVYDARADRRAQFLPPGTTPVTQYLAIHVRRLGGLSVHDAMDLLEVDEDAGRTALTALRLTRTEDGRYVQAS